MLQVDYGHEEIAASHGKDPREYLVCSKEFLSDSEGRVRGVKAVRVEWTKDASGRWQMSNVEGSEQVFEADLVLIAMGFLGPEKTISLQEQKEDRHLELDGRGNYNAPYGSFLTTQGGVFAAGDCRRGQSLVVWAINGKSKTKQFLLSGCCVKNHYLCLFGFFFSLIRGSRRCCSDRSFPDGQRHLSAMRFNPASAKCSNNK